MLKHSIQIASSYPRILSGLVGKTLLYICKGRGFKSHPSNMPVICSQNLGEYRVYSAYWCKGKTKINVYFHPNRLVIQWRFVNRVRAQMTAFTEVRGAFRSNCGVVSWQFWSICCVSWQFGSICGVAWPNLAAECGSMLGHYTCTLEQQATKPCLECSANCFTSQVHTHTYMYRTIHSFEGLFLMSVWKGITYFFKNTLKKCSFVSTFFYRDFKILFRLTCWRSLMRMKLR